MKIEKKCVICSKSFNSYDVGKRIFNVCCSIICANINKQGKKVSYIVDKCKTCDKEFDKPHFSSKEYCSKKCQHNSLIFWGKASEQQKLDRLKQKYEKFVEKTSEGCWKWNGASQKRYGCFSYDRGIIRAHRASWIIHFGEIPSGYHVLHKCDNPECSNPNHLFLGSHKDNMRDMRSKNLHKQYSKLTIDQVKEIKKLLNDNLTQKSIGELFGVDHVTISDIKRGVTWKNI